ncbi:ferredoxin-type protein NapF [Oryzomicrobium sp.]|uniref:ferredoxin-type protein NapF n=1 Tax=Oryzomicrobium sp. TaxID=1911578 RepID=UPI002FE3DF5E
MTQLARRHLLFGRFRQAGQGAVLPFRPPWSLAWTDEAAFAAACSRCDACIAACPAGVLKRGDGGFPELTFAAAGCTLCRECVSACRDGAFAADAVEPWNLAVAFTEACLPGRGVECRSCGEHCEAGAIRFRPRLGGAPLPALDADACTGCGACVPVCPAGAIEPRRRAAGSSPLPAAERASAPLFPTEAP